MKRIVLLRHAESTWNQENRFTRWPDVGPIEKGLAEARAAGAMLRDEGLAYDLAFTLRHFRQVRCIQPLCHPSF